MSSHVFSLFFSNSTFNTLIEPQKIVTLLTLCSTALPLRNFILSKHPSLQFLFNLQGNNPSGMIPFLKTIASAEQFHHHYFLCKHHENQININSHQTNLTTEDDAIDVEVDTSAGYNCQKHYKSVA